MCQTNKWKSFRAVHTDGKLRIIAQRSDGLILQEEIKLEKKDISAALAISFAINSIETYRNCKCTQEKLCPIHEKLEKEQIEKCLSQSTNQ